jgi:hypothetical protein
MSTNMDTDHHTSTEAIPAERLAVVVFGLDDKNRPHASAFTAGEAEPAEKAALLMSFNVFKPDTDEHRAFASQLPRGRVFGSGKAFVPFVSSGDYERLCAFAGVSAAQSAATAKHDQAGALSSDNVVPMANEAKLVEKPTPLVQAIVVGSVVLACETDDGGFFEAKVIGVEADVLSLEWQYYPGEPSFKRRVTQVSPIPLEDHFWEL